MKNISFFGQSHTGCVRTNNEDNFVLKQQWDEQHILAVVIDGVGGYEGGEVAADIAAHSITEYLDNHSNGDCLELMKQAVIYANNRIYQERKIHYELSRMSCVLTAALIDLNAMRINMAHVGDTRLYQFTDGHIEKLSHDHSLVGYREEIGELTEEEAMTHPNRNIISKDLGSILLQENNSYVEVASYPLDSNTQILLCSDGLCDMVHSKVMTRVLSLDSSVVDKVNELIDCALQAGGRDNVTVIVVDIESDENLEESDNQYSTCDEEQPSCVNSKGHHRNCRCPKLCVALLIITAIVAGVILYQNLNSGNAPDEKISADTTLVAPADTISCSDSLGQ